MDDRKLVIRAAVELLLVALIAVLVWSALYEAGLADEDGCLYVTADVLNGRAQPSKRAHAEAVFDYGDQLIPTGRMSKNREWVEVLGGEAGTVWVHIKYVTERREVFTVTNENNGKIKIRSKPVDGKVRGYVRRGKSIEIDRVILGWGHCKSGWVDLEYFVEEDE